MAISEQDLLKRDVLKSHIDAVNQRKLDMGPPSPRGNDYTRPVDEHVARGYFDEANEITPLGEEFLTLYDNGLVDNFGMATELGQSYLISNREAQDAPVSVYRFREESGLAEAERFAASQDGDQRGFSDMIYDFATKSIPSAVETGYNIAIAPVAETALSVPRKIAELATGVDYKLPRTMSPNDITNAVAENMTGSILASEDIAAGAVYAGTMAMDDPATFGANILDKLPYGLVVRKVAGDPVMDEMVRRKTDESFAAKQAFERSRSEIAELTGAQMMETVAPIFQWAKAREQLVAQNGEEAVKSKEEDDRLLGSIALDPENVLSLGAGIAIKGATTAVAKTNLWAATTSLKNAALQAERAAVQSEMSAIQAGLTRPAQWISDAEMKSKALVEVGDFQGATRYNEFIKRVNLKSEVPLQRISELSATEAKLGDEITQLGSSPDIANAILASKEKAASFRNLTAGGFGLTGVVGDKIGSAMIKADDFLDAASKNMGIDSAVSALKSLPAAIGGYVMGGVPAGVTAALNVIARGKVVQSMGNFSKVLGSELMQERGSIGYWGRVAQNSTLTKAQRFLAHRADELTLGGSLMDVARPVVAGTVAAYPMNLAFETVSNPDASGQEILTNAMGPALVFGGGSAGAGAVLEGRQAHLSKIRMADEYNFTRRMAEQSTEGSQAFSSLVPSAKRMVSTLAATYPNLNWTFLNNTESYYDPTSNTINVNPESNNPLRPLISHEVLHYVTIRNQMEPVVHSALLGDSETPGLIRNTDGTLDPEFKAFKDVYDARIANANLPPRTIEQVAEEYFNEATVDELLSMVDTGEVSRIAGRTQLGRKVKALIDATIPKITILKDLFTHTGGVRGMDGKPVMGNGLLAEGIRDLPEAKAIMRKLIRDSAGQDPTRATSGDRSGTRIEIKRGDSIIDSFHSIFEVDANNIPIRDKNGDPVPLSRATDEARKSAGLVIGEAQRNKVSNGYLPKEGEMKQQANGSWQGRYIDKSLIDVLAGRGILNPKQIAILRNLSTATKGNQGLRFLLTNHPATIRNRKGKLNYATLEATLRELVPVGFSITKDGNILVHNMSVGQLDANITARAGSKRGIDLYSGNTESIKRDVSEMMELHQKNTATDEFYQNKYGSRWKEYQQFINTVFGLMTKEQQSINPMFQSDSISSQKGQVYRTYRLDRISKATRMDGATSMPFHYENIKMNFLPDGFIDATKPVDQSAPVLPQTAANIIALAKELDPVGLEVAVEDWKNHIKRSEADGIMYSDVLKGDKITLAAQSVLVKFADKDPRAMRMLEGYGEDQFSNLKPTRYLPEGEQTQNIDDIRKQWDNLGIQHGLSERSNEIEPGVIKVPKEERNQGIGNKAMSILIDYADKVGKRIVVSPTNEFGSNKQRLTNWYKKLGFVENKGRNKDYTTRKTMYRDPISKAVSSQGSRFLPEAVDAEYMKAVESGDVEMQQKMVDEAARTSGGLAAYKGFAESYPLSQEYGGFFAKDKKEADKFDDAKASKKFYLFPNNMAVIDGRNHWPGEIQAGAFVSIAEFGKPSVAAIKYRKAMENESVDVIQVTETLGEGTIWNVKPKSVGQIKSADPITRDGSGKVIPLSQRFNPTTSDIRYLPGPINPAAPNVKFIKPLSRTDAIPDIDSTLISNAVDIAGFAFDRPAKVYMQHPNGQKTYFNYDPAYVIKPEMKDLRAVLAGKNIVILEADKMRASGGDMGGVLHPFLRSNQVTVRGSDGKLYKAIWANMNSAFVTRTKNRWFADNAEYAVIHLMDNVAHSSNKRVARMIDEAWTRAKLTNYEQKIVAVAMQAAITAQKKSGFSLKITQAKRRIASGKLTAEQVSLGNNAISEWLKKRDKLSWKGVNKEVAGKIKTVKSAQTRLQNKTGTQSNLDKAKKELKDFLDADPSNMAAFDALSKRGATLRILDNIGKTFKSRGAAIKGILGITFNKFDPSDMLKKTEDFQGSENMDIVAAVQLSKNKDIFAVYFGNNPKEEAAMSKSERTVRDKLRADPNFVEHEAFDWMMLGPENADNFLAESSLKPEELISEYRDKHPKVSVNNGSEETVLGAMKMFAGIPLTVVKKTPAQIAVVTKERLARLVRKAAEKKRKDDIKSINNKIKSRDGIIARLSRQINSALEREAIDKLKLKMSVAEKDKKALATQILKLQNIK